jgi:hypothetical protein
LVLSRSWPVKPGPRFALRSRYVSLTGYGTCSRCCLIFSLADAPQSVVEL